MCVCVTNGPTKRNSSHEVSSDCCRPQSQTRHKECKNSEPKDFDVSLAPNELFEKFTEMQFTARFLSLSCDKSFVTLIVGVFCSCCELRAQGQVEFALAARRRAERCTFCAAGVVRFGRRSKVYEVFSLPNNRLYCVAVFINLGIKCVDAGAPRGVCGVFILAF